MSKLFNLLTLTALFSAAAFPQASKFDVYADYSYMQFNPALTGVQSRAFNGGGGGAQWNITDIFGIKGDFQGYGSTTVKFTATAPVVTSHGTIPAGTYSSQGNMFTYLFGPTVGLHAKKVYVYGEYLMGGSNSNLYGNLTKAINSGGGTFSASGTQHPFTSAFGGGIDVAVNKNVALRLAEVDWILTLYSNPITNTNNQNNFRYLGGVVFTFGAK